MRPWNIYLLKIPRGVTYLTAPPRLIALLRHPYIPDGRPNPQNLYYHPTA
jgi:hypothetical protein